MMMHENPDASDTISSFIFSNLWHLTHVKFVVSHPPVLIPVNIGQTGKNPSKFHNEPVSCIIQSF